MRSELWQSFRRAREALGLTNRRCALLAGIHPTTALAYEGGKYGRPLTEAKLWAVLETAGPNTLGARMLIWRQQQNLSQRAAAKWAGVPAQQWRRIEQGLTKSRPCYVTGPKVERFLASWPAGKAGA